MVLAREPRDETALVLVHPPDQVVGDAGVQYTRATGHDVHTVGAHGPPKWGPRARSHHYSSAARSQTVNRKPVSLSSILSERACHPERRRREGPACLVLTQILRMTSRAPA